MTGTEAGPARRIGVILAVLGLAAGPVPLSASAAPTPVPPDTSAAVPGGLVSPATPGAGPGSSAPPSATDPARSRGADLFLRSCASCHGPRGEGTQRGPSLVGVGPASVDFQLSTGRMPLDQEAAQPPHRRPAFSAADIQAIVGHVGSFGGGGPQIPTVGPGDLREGRELFLAHCAACHSAAGVGATLTNGLVAPSLDRSTPVQVAEAIRVGPGLMPAFPESILSPAQVDAVASYVQHLRGDRLDRGGASLGRLGPMTEGLVAWVVGLALLVGVARWLGSRAGR
ncbi:c-type cytochrome [Micromonospora sp. HM5-17]|uniref:cytochrome bc1 complex diheme cytochrome c subunit n=1 Tax=Micromonospora sp. HM5-17 TaxID=2487710 RepID=UPI0011CE52EE|nr:c-type cytochrome [Micromonospora sp. HM5-17]